MYGETHPQFFENEPKPMNIREIIANQIPLESTPAADLLAFQVERNVEQFRREMPAASHQLIALTVASRMLDIDMYRRISNNPSAGPKEFEREEKLKDMERRRSAILSSIHTTAETLEADVKNNVHYSEGWMYLDRNIRGKTAYRIYLSVVPEDVGSIFLEIAKTIPSDVGFQMKTFNDRVHYAELARSDKVILYGSEGSIDKLIETVRIVHKKHQRSFAGRKAPPGGVPTEMAGVSVADESEEQNPVTGKKKTATQAIAKKIEIRIQEKSAAVVKRRFSKFKKDLAGAANSEEGKILLLSAQNFLENLKTKKASIWNDFGVSDNALESTTINQAFAASVCKELISVFIGEKQDVSKIDCWKDFLVRLKNAGISKELRDNFASPKLIKHEFDNYPPHSVNHWFDQWTQKV
jgi:hypothetical protein